MDLVFECADQCVEVWVPMGDFLFQFVVPTLDVIYGTGYICVEVVPYVSVTVDLDVEQYSDAASH
jgi:hypothetical protein